MEDELTKTRPQPVAASESTPPVILASASGARKALLDAAGVPHRVIPAAVDEDSVKTAMTAEGASPGEVAAALAALKAVGISDNEPGAVVIGADQLLVCGGEIFGKPANLDAARLQLEVLRGCTHELVTAVCLAVDGAVIWRHTETARLTMRPFSDRFIDRYLGELGDTVLSGPGGYQVEGRGAQLFTAIAGDWYSIVGLPLLPVLEMLRLHGAMRS